jgi:hypothetical protein
MAPRYRSVVDTAPVSSVRRRPSTTAWSALEYLCHVRDVLLIQRERVVLAQVEENPTPSTMHRDERVTLCAYDAQPPDAVLDQIAMGAELLALAFEQLTASEWARPLRYTWPEPATRDLAWLARNVVHEDLHHLGDIERLLGTR